MSGRGRGRMNESEDDYQTETEQDEQFEVPSDHEVDYVALAFPEFVNSDGEVVFPAVQSSDGLDEDQPFDWKQLADLHEEDSIQRLVRWSYQPSGRYCDERVDREDRVWGEQLLARLETLTWNHDFNTEKIIYRNIAEIPQDQFDRHRAWAFTSNLHFERLSFLVDCMSLALISIVADYYGPLHHLYAIQAGADFCAYLCADAETKEWLVVYEAGCHPGIECNRFIYANSDGSGPGLDLRLKPKKKKVDEPVDGNVNKKRKTTDDGNSEQRAKEAIIVLQHQFLRRYRGFCRNRYH